MLVISETVTFTVHKTQKESYASRSADIYYYYYIIFVCSQNVSSGIVLLICCICTTNMHKPRNLHENLRMCVCVSACVRVYVCRGCCNINEIIKMTPESGRSGQDYGVVKSFDLGRSTTKLTK